MSADNDRPRLSSIFVDFDNIYLCLLNQDSKAAKNFATQPQRWFAWLDEYLQQTLGLQRRIAVRRCYMNPRVFGDFRPYYMQCGFEVVDCPALTASGKTSADIRIAIDMLELLDFGVHYEEFVLLSADADFTPVMLKLRKCDRSTVMLGVGGSSPIYRASCNTIISQDDFIAEALIGADLSGSTLLSVGRRDMPPSRGNGSHPVKEDAPLTAEEMSVISQQVTRYVQAASAPVTMAALAHLVRDAKPELGPDWAGCGSFKQFFARLPQAGLVVSSVGPSYVYDPAIHTPPGDTEAFEKAQEFAQRYPELAETAKKVSSITDIPYLMPEQYANIFAFMAEEINARGYNMTQVSKTVRDRCRDANLPVARQQVNFILTGIAYQGHRFGEETETPDILARVFLRNAMNLCEKSLIELSDEERRRIQEWLAGGAGRDNP